MKILVAGFGNVLRRDDGFGVRVLDRLEAQDDLPDGVTLLEVGIGGVSLVQELMTGYDAVVLLDAIEGERAGEVKTLELAVTDPASFGVNAARDYLADIHYAEPGRALALAKGVGSLPPQTYLVGCVPTSCEWGEGLSSAVEDAVPDALAEVSALLTRLASGDRRKERSPEWSRSESAPPPNAR